MVEASFLFGTSNSVVLSPGVDGRIHLKYVLKVWDIQRRCWLARTPSELKEVVADMGCPTEPAAKKRPGRPMAIEDAQCNTRPSPKKMRTGTRIHQESHALVWDVEV